jgi:hypothetical protein
MLPEIIKNRPHVSPQPKTPVPFLFSEEIVIEEKTPLRQELSKLALFEKGLAGELKASDSIDATLNKIVRMALAAEFGIAFIKSAGAKKMIKTLVRGIKEDRALRKSALMIADKFAK